MQNLAGGPRILVVDDDPSSSSAIATALAGLGSRTLLVTGLEALTVLDERIDAVAILEVGIQDISGIELLRRLRERSPATGVIMVSQCATIRDAIAAMREGASDFLAKPIDLQKLRQSTIRCIESWQQRLSPRHPRSGGESSSRNESPSESGARLPEFNNLTSNAQSAVHRLEAGTLPPPGGRCDGPGPSPARD